MPRIACLPAIVAPLALALASSCFAAAPQRSASHTSHPQSRPAPAPAPVIARPMVFSYATPYASRMYPSSVRPRTTNPLSFVPAASPDAPRFSFSPQDPPEGWNWQRVSLQQVDAEVRARRAATLAKAGSPGR